MMWLKTVGIALLLSGCGSYGLIGARRLERRVEQIKDLRLALEFLEKEISYLHTPLSLALERTAQFAPPPVKILFSSSSARLQSGQGITAAEAFSCGVAKLKERAALREEDYAIMRSLSNQLGASGPDEQKKLIRLTTEELKIQEEKARQNAASSSKLWSYGGFIAGALVVLLLL
jgi:stage III sporulation protein AB